MQCQLFSHERIFLLQNNFPLYIECVQCGMKVFFTPYKTVNKISERILSSKIVLKTFLYTLNAFNVKWKFSLLHKTVNKISERMRCSKFFSFIHWKCSMWIESFLCFIRQWTKYLNEYSVPKFFFYTLNAFNVDWKFSLVNKA